MPGKGGSRHSTKRSTTPLVGFGADVAVDQAKKARVAALQAAAGTVQGKGSIAPFISAPDKELAYQSNLPETLTGANAIPVDPRDALQSADDQAFSQYLSSLATSAPKTFTGNEQDYIKKAEAELPKVSYAALQKAASAQAASNDKDIAGIYGALGGYITGQGKAIQGATAAAGKDYQANAQAAEALLAGSADAGRQSTASALNSIGGFQGTGETDAQKASLGQQDAVGTLLASRLGSELENNTSRGQTAFNFNAQQGNIAQQQGAESRTSLKQALAQQQAAYAEKQSEANAANALQALQLGSSQFNADRSYYSTEASQAASLQNQIAQALLGRSDSALSTYDANQTAAAKQDYTASKDSATLDATNRGNASTLYSYIYRNYITANPKDAKGADQAAKAAVNAQFPGFYN